MPDKSYKIGSDIYDIPDAEVGSFLKDNPKAVEVESYLIDKDTFDIPIGEVPDFIKDNPAAQPVKKKILPNRIPANGQAFSNPFSPNVSQTTPATLEGGPSIGSHEPYKSEVKSVADFNKKHGTAYDEDSFIGNHAEPSPEKVPEYVSDVHSVRQFNDKWNAKHTLREMQGKRKLTEYEVVFGEGKHPESNDLVKMRREAAKAEMQSVPESDTPNHILDRYNITSYATNPAHETNVNNLYQDFKSRQLTDSDSIDRYIKEVTPKSPISGEMILGSAKKFGVEPEAILAIIQEDSSIGTRGKGARTNNPGNVGNDDLGNLRKFATNQDGLDAVAKWLKKHQLDEHVPQFTAKAPVTAKVITLADFNKKYGTNRTLAQMQGKEPVPQVHPEDEGILTELYHSAARGSDRLGGMIARTPSIIFDIAALPQNLIQKYTGLNVGTSSAQLAEQLGLPENEVANYYDNAVAQSQQKIQEKYDKPVSEYFSNGEYSKGFKLLANQVVESAPISISMMMGNAAGLTATQSILGGGAVFAAGKKQELDQQNPEMGEADKTAAALANGLFEGIFEQFGVTKLGGVVAGMIKKEGKEAALELAKKGFLETYTPIMKKYIGVGFEESLSEAATQFAQNAVDKYSGAKPDLDLRDGVIDAAIVGLGSAGAFSLAPASIETLTAKKNREKASKLAEEKAAVEKDITNPNIPDEAKAILSAKAQEINEQAADVFAKDKADTEHLTPEAKTEIQGLNKQIDQIELTITNPDNVLSEASKSALEDQKAELEKEVEGIVKEGEKPDKTLDKPKAESVEKPEKTDAGKAKNDDISSDKSAPAQETGIISADETSPAQKASILNQDTDLKGEKKENFMLTPKEYVAKSGVSDLDNLGLARTILTVSYPDEIKMALYKGVGEDQAPMLKAISEGRMTASDAVEIIKSAGVEVPKNIQDLAEVESKLPGDANLLSGEKVNQESMDKEKSHGEQLERNSNENQAVEKTAMVKKPENTDNAMVDQAGAEFSNKPVPDLTPTELETANQQAVKEGNEKPPVPPAEKEAEEKPDDPRLSGIKKALVPEEKIEETDIERKSTAQMLATGKELVDSGEMKPEAIIAEINTKARALQPEEVAALVYYKTKLDNAIDAALDDVEQFRANGDLDSQLKARAELTVLLKAKDEYHEMSVRTAYEQSLAFRLRQMLLDSEYNLQSQIRRYKAVNNGVIPAEVQEKFEEYDRQIKELNKKLKEFEDNKGKDEGQGAVDDIKESVDREYKKPKVKSGLSEEKKARKRELAKKLFNRFNDVTTIAQLIADKEFYEYSGLVLEEAKGKFEDFATEILDTVGKGIRSLLPELYTHLGGKGEIIFPDTEITIKDGKLIIPPALIRDLVAAGFDNIETLTNEVYNRLHEDFPAVTHRQVRDAITNYGKTINMSQEELDVKIRELKRTGKLISGLEDVQNKKRPLRSGLQRDKLNAEERRLTKAIREGMKDFPVSDADVKKAWTSAIEAVKNRLRNQIEELEKQIETGEKTPKKKGIEYDAEAKALVEKRDDLKKIIEDIEGKPKMSDEQRLRQATAAVERNIVDLQRRIDTKDFSTAEKAATPVSELLTSLKTRREELKKAFAVLQEEEGIAEKKRLELMKKNLSRSIGSLEKRLADKDFAPKTKKPKPYPDAEAKALEREKILIKEKYDVEVEKARRKNRPLKEKLRDAYVDIVSIPKSLQSTLDFSAPLRQGAVLSYSHPVLAAKSFVEMFKYFGSEEKYKNLIADIKVSDKYNLIRASKLYLSEPSTKLAAKEEEFVSNFVHRIPVYGKLVKASERAYTGYLNHLRLAYFAQISDAMVANGLDPNTDIKPFKDLATFINNATGRGDLGALEKSADLLNTAFFSPRYIASRMNLLWPPTYAKMEPAVRKEALKSMGIYLGAWASVQLLWALAHSADADDDDPFIELDPRSSDFGKLRLGKTRYDVSAGFGPLIVFLARMIPYFGGYKYGDKVLRFEDEKKRTQSALHNKGRGEVTLKFLRSKASPFAGTVIDFATKKRFMGEPTDIPSEMLESLTGKKIPYSKEVIEKVMPLYFEDFYEIAQDEGFGKAALLMTPSIFGVGVQHYEDKKRKK